MVGLAGIVGRAVVIAHVTRKVRIMTGNGTYVSLYDQRVKLVADVVTAHSELSEEVAVELARRVLYALDHIPERVRYSGK